MTERQPPDYDYDADPLSETNRLAARAKGWQYDADWHDHRDKQGYFVRSRFHDRPSHVLDPAALK